METALVTAASEGQTDLGPLNEQEQSDLAHCEETIGRGLQSFVEVGRALQTVRDSRLYRAEYETFEDYCLERWQVGRAHANRYIDASAVASILSPIGDTPANESQARPLTRIRTIKGALDKRAISRVWRKVVDDAPADDSGRKVITAKVVEEAVRPTLRKRAKQRSSSSESVVESTPGLVGASPQERAIASKIERIAKDAAEPTRENITKEEFLQLHKLALWLHKLTTVPSMEMSPQGIRQCAEQICSIVLGNPT